MACAAPWRGLPILGARDGAHAQFMGIPVIPTVKWGFAGWGAIRGPLLEGLVVDDLEQFLDGEVELAQRVDAAMAQASTRSGQDCDRTAQPVDPQG